jgi:Protein of unknown function (DUF2586)
MSIKQGVNINILDNQLGQSVPGQGPTNIVIGYGSAGPNYVPFTSTNPGAFVTQNGYGEGPELAAYIANLSGNPVCLVTVPAGSVGAVTGVKTGAGNTSTSAVTLTGTPFDSGYGVVTVQVGGTVGTGPIVLGVSIDGGATTFYTANLGTANQIGAGTNFTTVTGLTLNFGAGTLVAGDAFYWVNTPPLWTDAAVQSALNATLTVTGVIFEDVFVAGGSVATAGGGAAGMASADVTAFDGYLTTFQNTNKRFNRMLTAARDAIWGGASTETEATWMTSIEGVFAASSSLRVGVCAGAYRFISPITQAQMRRNLLWGAAARDAGVAIQVDLGRVSDGALPNLVLPTKADTFGAGTCFYHDESLNPGLDAARFLSAWQIVGLPGVFIMNPNLMAPPGSDFNWLQHGHVIDAMSVICYGYFVKALSSSVRVSAKTGFILPQDALRLQNECNGLLLNQLTNPGAVSSATVTVSQTDNILSTASLTVSGQIVPLGYLKAINVTLSFLNPAFVVVQVG